MNRTILFAILYSSNCFMIVFTIDRIKDMLNLEINSSLNLYYKCMLGFNFSVLGYSIYTLVELNRLIKSN
jgi:hypothetical protein